MIPAEKSEAGKCNPNQGYGKIINFGSVRGHPCCSKRR